MKASMVHNDTGKPVLISWGFHQTTGGIYLDAFLDLEKDPHIAKLIFLRAHLQHANVAFLLIPEGIGRDEIQDWMSIRDEAVMELLKRARVLNPDQVVRKKEESNCADYMMHS